jgi:hypothetical protein
MQTGAARAEVPEEKTCIRCHTDISANQDHEATPDGVVCRPCHSILRSQQEMALQVQGVDVNYPAALLGALLGGTVGVLAWWTITVMSNIAFGIVAILIGIAVGKGATLLGGENRSRGLQIMSAIVAGVSFFYATYLVNRTFIQQALAKQGKEIALSLLPNPAMFLGVVSMNLGAFDLLFLGIVLWEAWKLTAPVKLR